MDVNDGVRVKDAENCLLCDKTGTVLYQGLRDRLFSAPGIWNYLRCPDCSLVWLHPHPVLEDINKLYGDYYTHNAQGSSLPLASMRRKLEHAVLGTRFGYGKYLANSPREKIIGELVSLISPLRDIAGARTMWLEAGGGGHLLDIGCGNGEFLAFMRELGWEVVGVEPDPEAAQIAQSKFGLEVIYSDLREVGLPKEFFTAITMSHVIEHMVDPMEVLYTCHQLLKPNGRLIVVTPNVESLGHQVFGAAWRGLEPPRHLFLFSKSTLSDCLSYAGFEIQTIRATAARGFGIWLRSRLIKENRIQANKVRSPYSYILKDLAFWISELLLAGIKPQIGEEIVAIGVKR